MWISADAYQEDPGIIHRVCLDVEICGSGLTRISFLRRI